LQQALRHLLELQQCPLSSNFAQRGGYRAPAGDSLIPSPVAASQSSKGRRERDRVAYPVPQYNTVFSKSVNEC
jgi:hypothetical protein